MSPLLQPIHKAKGHSCQIVNRIVNQFLVFLYHVL